MQSALGLYLHADGIEWLLEYSTEPSAATIVHSASSRSADIDTRALDCSPIN